VIRRSWLVPLAGVLALTGIALGIALSRGGDSTKVAASGGSHLQDRFALLSERDSNQCSLAATNLDRLATHGRLQGSCCFPMDYRSYAHQVRELKRRYATVDVIPKDPYDIPVGLAKRLIGYGSIKLTPTQQRTYEGAKLLSETKGPCCCRCWRWTAFSGQAKYLIARRRFSARQIAEVWSLEEGCGGPSHEHV